MITGMEFSERAIFSYSKKDATRALVVLVTIALIFALLHLITNVVTDGLPFDDLLDLDGEQTFPAFFSSLQLFAIGVLFGLAYRYQEKAPQLRFLFLMLSLAFLFLAADEALYIHESITEYANYWEIDWLTRFAFGGTHGIWVTVYGILGVVFLLVLIQPFYTFWKNYRFAAVRLFWGAVVFGTGAVVLEVSSYLFDLREPSRENWYEIEVMLEELLEMWGGSLMLYGALLLLIQIQARMRLPQRKVRTEVGKKVPQTVDDLPE